MCCSVCSGACVESYGILQHSATACCSVLQCVAVSVRVRAYNITDTAAHCNTLQHTATHCSTLQYTAAHCNTLQYPSTNCNPLQPIVLRHSATLCSAHCNTQQPTAIHSNPLQTTATHSNTLCIDSLSLRIGTATASVLQSVLQCVAVSYNALQLLVTCNSYSTRSLEDVVPILHVSPFVAECCSVLQRVAECCSVLQRVAACCRVLQRVAECCSVLRSVAECCRVL